MGEPGYEIKPEDEDITYTIARFKKIENIPVENNLKNLCLRQNLITTIENLDDCVKLEILDLYDNRLKNITGLDKLINLKELDLS